MTWACPLHPFSLQSTLHRIRLYFGTCRLLCLIGIHFSFLPHTRLLAIPHISISNSQIHAPGLSSTLPCTRILSSVSAVLFLLSFLISSSLHTRRHSCTHTLRSRSFFLLQSLLYTCPRPRCTSQSNSTLQFRASLRLANPLSKRSSRLTRVFLCRVWLPPSSLPGSTSHCWRSRFLLHLSCHPQTLLRSILHQPISKVPSHSLCQLASLPHRSSLSRHLVFLFLLAVPRWSLPHTPLHSSTNICLCRVSPQLRNRLHKSLHWAVFKILFLSSRLAPSHLHTYS